MTMFKCELCGELTEERERCFLKRRDSKTKNIKYLKVCHRCKYGEK